MPNFTDRGFSRFAVTLSVVAVEGPCSQQMPCAGMKRMILRWANKSTGPDQSDRRAHRSACKRARSTESPRASSLEGE